MWRATWRQDAWYFLAPSAVNLLKDKSYNFCTWAFFSTEVSLGTTDASSIIISTLFTASFKFLYWVLYFVELMTSSPSLLIRFFSCWMHRKDLTLPYFLSSTLIFYQTQSRSKQPAPLITNLLNSCITCMFASRLKWTEGIKEFALRLLTFIKQQQQKQMTHTSSSLQNNFKFPSNLLGYKLTKTLPTEEHRLMANWWDLCNAVDETDLQ